MRVLLTCRTPFFLAHGGMQNMIECLMEELCSLGIQAEALRWWDAGQRGDVIHFFQRPSLGEVVLAKQHGFKTVMTEVIDIFASQPKGQLALHTLTVKLLGRFIPPLSQQREIYQMLDALVYITKHEMQVASWVFGWPIEKGLVIGHGLKSAVLEALAAPAQTDDYLICVGTICGRKNMILLAKAAKLAEVPVLFVGKPLSERDPYFGEFQPLIDDRYVRYIGYVDEETKWQLLRSARGFVLLSLGESGCLAVHEAAAAGLPLLLARLPWATESYPASSRVQFVELHLNKVAASLRKFFQDARRSVAPTFAVPSWRYIAEQYMTLYQNLL
jgi:glycosyltransferase involved in cell wall biosynthesis